MTQNMKNCMKTVIKIEGFKKGDEKEILRLLDQDELPTEDLTPSKLKNFLVARVKGGPVIGAIGVEPYQDVGLLRSLVVDVPYRGKGLGTRLVLELQSFAKRKGVKTLFLLTIAAKNFFKKLGYETIRRSSVPAPIADTEEFKSLCPVSVRSMFKSLGPERNAKSPSGKSRCR